ncbi:MAG: hypothetical protein FJ220_06170 [Kiritimatiellaceae bacterium]|nr:hypothetical protein [Kiritimatiellaceae bacterium]
MGLFGKTKSVLVVDTAAVLKTKGMRGGASPRQQLQLLRALSRFVQREKLNATAVLVGAPLDKAPHNQIFEDVRVRYAQSDAVLEKELIASLKQAGSGGVLVTEDVALENRLIRNGSSTLRVSTFRKLLDEVNEPGESNGGGNPANNNRPPQRNNPRRERDRDRGPRQPNRNPNAQQPRPQQQQQQQQQQPRAEGEQVVVEERKNSNGNDAISQMIDLVD